MDLDLMDCILIARPSFTSHPSRFCALMSFELLLVEDTLFSARKPMYLAWIFSVNMVFLWIFSVVTLQSTPTGRMLCYLETLTIWTLWFLSNDVVLQYERSTFTATPIQPRYLAGRIDVLVNSTTDRQILLCGLPAGLLHRNFISLLSQSLSCLSRMCTACFLSQLASPLVWYERTVLQTSHQGQSIWHRQNWRAAWHTVSAGLPNQSMRCQLRAIKGSGKNRPNSRYP